MKQRKGFVSNSSSSSFIISSKKEIKSIKIEIEFTGLTKISSLEEFKKYKGEDYEYVDEEQIKTIVEAFKKGEVIYVGDVATDDEDLASSHLCNNGIPKNPDYNIIQDSEY